MGGTAIAPGVPNSAVAATVAADHVFTTGFAQGELSCASPQANPKACLPPVSITAVPDSKLAAPVLLCNGAWALSIRSATRPASARNTWHAREHKRDLTQVNGYQTVCQGCFAPFPEASNRRIPGLAP